jgi:hypothetical protein
MQIPSLDELTRREKRLLMILVGMIVMMILSHQPEHIGLTLSLTFSWGALIMFFGMIGVLIFMPEH